MSLTIHRSERADALVEGLAQVLQQAPADPFAPDVVAVPSKGVERWIAQSLSAALGAATGATDGVCANVAFPSPGRLVRDAVTATVGIDLDEDPWAERRLPWALLEVIDGCAGEPWCVTLGRHLGLVAGAVDQGRRMAVAQKLARLFTAYGAERPGMLMDWLSGRDTDGYGAALEPDHVWQAELWRRVRSHLDLPSPAERIGPACDRLREEPTLLDLPQRISVFGATRLTTDQLQVLAALAAQRDVHLWLPHPSHALWQQIRQGRPSSAEVPARREDPTADVPSHPLARSLGRDARELQLRLLGNTHPSDDIHHPPTDTPATLLGALQRDVRLDRRLQGDHHLTEDDRSIEVHACHGRQRQVEVLRELVLGMLDDDPTLELRDIIVMCPDIEAYAPLIHATFGLEVAGVDLPGEPHPGHRLSVRLADRSLRQTNPVLGVAARLLELADARVTASQVLDLAAMPPVRNRFGFDEDALERIGDWAARAGVRWGLDAEARARYGLDEITQNTWRAGLDRLLLGVAMDEDDLRMLGSALPLDDVDSTEIDLAGRLAELVDRLGEAVTALSGEQTLDEWVTALGESVESLVQVSPQDAWQVSQARWQLTDALASADEYVGATLRLSDVRALLQDRLQGRPTRANFRTGHLTMCTMVPMRSVPHRVVCLLGLDDGVFPRGSRIDGDDVLARNPRVGERDARSEDRQLFLDAILAAQDRLVILYTGADERTGTARPPAVPVGELLDVLDRTARGARDRVLVRHPLQPFDSRNFEPAALVGSGPFSFDSRAYAGSRALLGDRTARPPFLAEPLPQADPEDVVELDALIRFLEHPAKAFLRQRLGLSTAEEQDEADEAIPLAPDPLELWGIGNRLLDAGLAGIPAGRATEAERARGQLPPGPLGELALEPVLTTVTGLVDATNRLRSIEATHLDVALDLPSGATLAGTVPGVRGDCLVRVVYSKLAPKHRLRAWVQLLALAAQWPATTWQAKTVGRNPNTRATDKVAMSQLHAPAADEARRQLDALVRIYREGLCEPLLLPPATACVYADKRRGGVAATSALAFAGRAWRSTNDWGGPQEIDPEYELVFGDSPLVDLVQDTDGEDPDHPDEPHRFGRLARRVWEPLLAAEKEHTA